MKTNLTKLIILACLFLAACKPQNSVEPHVAEYMSTMVDKYFNNHCEYPENPDEFISYYNEISDLWMNAQISDTIQTVLSFLEDEKDNIEWICTHPYLEMANVVAIYGGDTLLNKTRINEFAYIVLNYEISNYIKYHLEYPKSLSDFLYFDSISDTVSENCINWFSLTWELDRNYLLDNQDKLEWIVDDDSFLIKSSQDTILYEVGYASRIRCDYFDIIRNRVLVLTDIKGKYDYDEEVRESFKTGLTAFRKDFFSKNQCDNYKPICMVEYRRGIGFSRFCENDDFSLDTKWFRGMEKYVSQFAQEHELERILFYTRIVEVK